MSKKLWLEEWIFLEDLTNEQIDSLIFPENTLLAITPLTRKGYTCFAVFENGLFKYNGDDPKYCTVKELYRFDNVINGAHEVADESDIIRIDDTLSSHFVLKHYDEIDY